MRYPQTEQRPDTHRTEAEQRRISADRANPKPTGLGMVSSLRLSVDTRARMAGKMLEISGDDRMGKAMGAANNISLPEPLLAEIQIAAQAEHRTVDEVLTDAVKRYVEDRSWTKLLDYGAERTKSLGIKESDIDRLIAESRAEQNGH